MALKQCPECKRELSETAKVCPHCGFKKPPAVSPVFATFLILVVCGVAAVAIILGVHVQQTNRAKAQLDESLRDADRMIQVYNRIFPSPTPKPPPVAPAYESRRQTKAATETTPPPPPPQFVTITEPGFSGQWPASCRDAFRGINGQIIQRRFNGQSRASCRNALGFRFPGRPGCLHPIQRRGIRNSHFRDRSKMNGTHNETLSVIAMCVSNADCSRI
jgi:RNA polymerase subunit RPABC4/transcription elongation factor Spt4